MRRGVNVQAEVRFGPGVDGRAEPGGQVILRHRVEVGGGTSLIAGPGATLSIAAGTFIAGGCTIAAARHVSIGAESMGARRPYEAGQQRECRSTAPLRP